MDTITHTLNDLQPIMNGWEEEKAQMMIRLDCSLEELDEMLDNWLDEAKEADYNQGWEGY